MNVLRVSDHYKCRSEYSMYIMYDIRLYNFDNLNTFATLPLKFTVYNIYLRL